MYVKIQTLENRYFQLFKLEMYVKNSNSRKPLIFNYIDEIIDNLNPT